MLQHLVQRNAYGPVPGDSPSTDAIYWSDGSALIKAWSNETDVTAHAQVRTSCAPSTWGTSNGGYAGMVGLAEPVPR